MPRVIYEMAGVSADGYIGPDGKSDAEFALICQGLPKVVFSRTLDSVEGAARRSRAASWISAHPRFWIPWEAAALPEIDLPRDKRSFACYEGCHSRA
jgi:hypothetical protein